MTAVHVLGLEVERVKICELLHFNEPGFHVKDTAPSPAVRFSNSLPEPTEPR